MLPDQVSNPGPLTYESGALPIALRGPARINGNFTCVNIICCLEFHKCKKVGKKLVQLDQLVKISKLLPTKSFLGQNICTKYYIAEQP